ncbi:MAG: DnaB-like helicase N-terminal domain-containing protein, partial [Acidimicrobiales bacterium]
MSDARQVVPHDDEAEAVLLGGALVWPHALEAVAGDLEAGDFYAPTHGRIWQAIADLLEEGSKPEVVLVADRVRRAGATIETARLAELMAGAVMPRRPVVELILRHSAARKLLGVLGEARQEIADGGDAFEVAQRGSADLDRVAAGASSDKPEALTMPELCDSADAVAPWVIRGLFRRDWRAVIVAPEGVGKSVLLRQLAVCAAQGVHPLRFERIPA